MYGVYVYFNGNGIIRLRRPLGCEVMIRMEKEKLVVPMVKEISVADAKRIVSLMFEMKSITGSGIISNLKRVALLYEALSEYCFAPGRIGTSSMHREAVRLRELIHAWAFENTSLDKTYEELDLSSGHAETLFRKAFGITPIAYRKNLRLQYARELLVSSQFNVSEIAYKAGFLDPLYFSRMFRKAFGVAPSSLIKDFNVSRKKGAVRM